MRTSIGLLFLLILTPVLAQDSDFFPYQRMYLVCFYPDREYFKPFGDLCSWALGETELTRETTSANIGEMAISPDGSKIAYLSAPEAYIEARNRGENPTGVSWRHPINIGMIDLTIPLDDPANFTIIADQTIPENADTNYHERPLPVWSPDSTQVAWIEQDLATDAFDGQLVSYDVSTHTTEIMSRPVGLGYADGGEWSIPELDGWSSVIAYHTDNAGVYPEQDNGGFGTLLHLFGETQSDVPISYFTNFEDRLTAVRMVMHREAWHVAMHYPNLGWVVLNTDDHSYELLENPPFVQAITRVGWQGHLVDIVAYPPVIEWRKGDIISEITPGMPLTFDPDGNPIWIDQSGFHLISIIDGNMDPIFQPSVSAAVWTPMIWATDGKSTSIEPEITP